MGRKIKREKKYHREALEGKTHESIISFERNTSLANAQKLQLQESHLARDNKSLLKIHIL